jgi:uncharacterized protein (TIGR02058 family)
MERDAMAERAVLIQTGMGVDLHGADDSVAARRAVEDAIRRNSLLFLRQIERPEQVLVDVTLGTPHPERVDEAAVRAVFPLGEVRIEKRAGGLIVETGVRGDPVLVAIAAVRVSIREGSAPPGARG